MSRLGVFVGSNPLPLSQLEPLAEVTTPWGDAACQVLCHRLSAGDQTHELLFLHRHGAQHEFAPHQINYRANVWLMHSLGVDGVVATYTVGGVDPALAVGDLVVPDQIIDYTWGRAHTFDDQLRHIDFSEPFDADLRRRLLALDETLVDGGVYGATQGPRLETAAEVARMGRDGCAVVGMTGMPEVSLCAELQMPVVALALVVNPAAGVSEEAIDMDDIAAAGKAGASRMVELLLGLIRA